MVAVGHVEGAPPECVDECGGVIAADRPDRLVDALVVRVEHRLLFTAAGDDRLEAVVRAKGERDGARRGADREQVAGQQVGPTGPYRLVPQDPPVAVLGDRHETHDPRLDVAAVRGVDPHAIQEQHGFVVAPVDPGVVETVHRIGAVADQPVDVIALLRWEVLLRAGDVQEAVRVLGGHGHPLRRGVGVVGAGDDPVDPFRIDHHPRKGAEDILVAHASRSEACTWMT